MNISICIFKNQMIERIMEIEKCYLLLILMLLKLEAVMIKNIFKDFKKINNS